ncbi:MAG: WecB/TagA/CpsF family glycosyltransferase [Treponema sp.]|nr:WecB/TagA/CpsF family glycosyltransferase [Treponema sp.]
MDSENHPIRERIELLKVPLDSITPENMAAIIYELLAAGEPHNIVLLSLWDLLRARRRGGYKSYVQAAALCIPIAKSLVSGAQFLVRKKPFRYMPFDFVVSLLSILETRELSVYLLGSSKKILLQTEKNIRQTFPGLQIVGRYPGFFKKYQEEAIIAAIRKASPSLLLVGKGIRGEEQWIYRNNHRLGRGMRLWCSDLFDVFANKKKRPSRFTFDNGLEWIGFCVYNPLHVFRIFPYLYYKILLVVYRFAKKPPKASIPMGV